MTEDPERGRLRAAEDGGHDEAPLAERSPRLRQPKHHRVVRPTAKVRRRAISAAGAMLLAAALLGVLTAVGVLSQAGATRPPVLPENPVEIQGTVTDLTGTTLVNATVRVLNGQNENRTNNEGWYFLEPVKPGTYTLEASKAGYQTVRKTVEVSPGIPKFVGFALAEGSGTLEVPPERVPHFVDPTVGALALGVAVLACSALAAVGGFSALAHRRYLFAVAGAAAGSLTVGPFFAGTILSVAALAILGSLKTGFLEAESHEIPWAAKSPENRRSRKHSR